MELNNKDGQFLKIKKILRRLDNDMLEVVIEIPASQILFKEDEILKIKEQLDNGTLVIKNTKKVK